VVAFGETVTLPFTGRPCPTPLLMLHEVIEPEVVHKSFTVSGGTMDVAGEAVKVTILTGVGGIQETEH
jgi:hypothetical protein